MTAAELAAWLLSTGHVDVEVVNDEEVVSVHPRGARRRYVLANAQHDAQLVGGDYWRLERR